MRVALIADIHGNLAALDVVLSDVAGEHVQQIVCLGDVAATGPQPHDVLSRLREVRCPIVMGNADAWLLDPSERPALEGGDLAKIAEIDRWCRAQLTRTDFDFIQTFRPTIAVEIDNGVDVLCVHGSPRSNTEIITVATPEADLALMLQGVDSPVVAGGHTHTAMLRRYQGCLIINPGSVGLPYERTIRGQVRHPPWAEFALVNAAHGRMDVEFRRVPIDVAAVRRSAESSSMPHADWWVQGWQVGA